MFLASAPVFLFPLHVKPFVVPSWCLFLPTRGTPRLYILGLFARRKAFLGTVETRRAACRQQRSIGNGGNTFFLEMDLCKIFDFFLCLSLPTRGTPRLYENTDAPRLYRNTFFLLSAHHKTFL
jgi:hypothetical protein